MSNIDFLAQDLTKIITEAKIEKTRPYDTPAEVVRIADGVAWVRIPGGVDETPAELTMNAKVGDVVQLRVSNSKAWITGNGTSPPTDDTRAIAAYNYAGAANQLANIANESAEAASQAAANAMSSADEAERAAKRADENADIAYNSATSAITHLSTIEDVVGTVNWIAQHGTYEISSDAEVIQGKLYFTLTGEAVTTPTGNPSEKKYYELSNNIYVLSTDLSVVSGKTYYEVSAASANPTGSPAGVYYQLKNLDSTVEKYISSHLALDDTGLSLVTDNVPGYVKLQSDGVVFYTEAGATAKYGKNSTIIGLESGMHIKLQSSTAQQTSRLSFMNGPNDEVAYISENQLYIPKAIVSEYIQVGETDYAWRWVVNANHDMGLYYVGV